MQKDKIVKIKKVKLKNSLSTKVSLANAIIILVAFTLMIFALNWIDYKLFVSKEKQMMNVYISNSLSSVDNKLKDMSRVSLICFSDDQTQNIIKGYHKYTNIEQMKNQDYLSELFTSLIKMRNDISGVYIFDKTSLIFYQDTSSPSVKSKSNIAEFIQQMDAMEQEASNLDGCSLVIESPPEFLRYNQNHVKKGYYSKCVYMIRDINSFSPYEKIGYIMLGMPIQKIKSLLDEYLQQGTSYLLVTKEGEIVCSADATLIGKDLVDLYPKVQNKITSNHGTFWGVIDGKKSMISYQLTDYSGLYLITSKPEASIRESINKFAQISVIIGILITLVTVVIMFKFTTASLYPLKKLSYGMANFSQSKMQKRYEVSTSDEAGLLISSFNQMMDYINELIEQKYENKVKLQEAQMNQQKMSLLYLKNQINQHFLYNTLDTIRIKAELNHDTDVSYMIMQLVSFFRLSIKVDNQIVSIDHEVKLMQAYLKLMCYRYPNIECEYVIDDSLLGVMIPNFILQPLVENCVMHGLKNCGYSGKIVLSVLRENRNKEYIELVLYDSGCGLSEETYQQMETMLIELKEDFWSKDANGDNHIGVMNVQQRLKMYYTPECGLRYYRNEEGGVTTSIRIKEKIDYMP